MGKRVTSFYFCFFVLAFLELTLYVKGMHHSLLLSTTRVPGTKPRWSGLAARLYSQASLTLCLKPILGVTFAHLQALTVFPFGPKDGGQGHTG